MSIFAGLGGNFGGRFDADLSSKIDQLVGNKTSQDKLAEQMREMGIDPDALPLRPKDATQHAQTFMSNFHDFDDVLSADLSSHVELNAVALEFLGSSLGFSKVIVHGSGEDYQAEYGDQGYPKKTQAKVVTQKDLGDDDTWHNFERIWNAHKGEFTLRFKIHAQYLGKTDEPVEAVKVKFLKDPRKLKAGQTARLEKNGESIYAKMGGLFDDTTLTNLADMKPIQPVSGWVVVEVIEE